MMSNDHSRELLRPSPLPTLQDLSEVGAIAGFPEVLNGAFKGRLVQEAHLEADLLQAGDAKPLAMLDDLYELRCI